MLRDREIAVDLPLLQILKDAGARPHPRIVIDLFDGANPELDIHVDGFPHQRQRRHPWYIQTAFERGFYLCSSTVALLVGTMQLGGRL